jgi:pimeloyl-ACP methyl ester carboxylesterase
MAVAARGRGHRRRRAGAAARPARRFRLESGETIRDCVIGYRTAAALASDRSNVIVFPTWASGTSEQIISSQTGPGGLIDTSKYHVIALDALGSGVSSSPSNSQAQPRMRFPRFGIRDSVRAHHAVLTQVLGLQRVQAVVGISMGGMQAFEWMVTYPDFEFAVAVCAGQTMLPEHLPELFLLPAPRPGVRCHDSMVRESLLPEADRGGRRPSTRRTASWQRQHGSTLSPTLPQDLQCDARTRGVGWCARRRVARALGGIGSGRCERRAEGPDLL